MDKRIHVGILHHNRLLSECLAVVLAKDKLITAEVFDDLNCEGVTTGGNATAVDTWLVDLSLPGGNAPECVTFLRRQFPDAQVLILIGEITHDRLINCLSAGARGCVLEDSSLDTLKQALLCLSRGDSYCSIEIVDAMYSEVSRLATQWQAPDESVALTPRERDVVELLAKRMTNQQIADALQVSLYTVKNHVHNVLEKLQVRNRHAVVEYARMQNWLTESRSKHPS